MIRGSGLRNGIFAAALVLLGACAKEPPPPPPPGIIDLTLSAAADVNPDEAGRASPVVVRVFQLASAEKFNAVDFFQLFDKEAATLGPDLALREEVALSPGETKKLTTPLKQGAQFVAVAVSFRDIDKSSWRAAVQVPPNGTTPLEAKIGKLDAQLGKPEKEEKPAKPADKADKKA